MKGSFAILLTRVRGRRSLLKPEPGFFFFPHNYFLRTHSQYSLTHSDNLLTMSNPAQGYKLSGLAEAGGGASGTTGENTVRIRSFPSPSKNSRAHFSCSQNQTAFANTSKGPADGPAQEVAGTLPQNFSLGPTKAESKGNADVRTVPQAHDVDEPANKPHFQAQANDSSKPVNSTQTDPADKDFIA